ncbi:uncharacterized protein LOC108905853 isoform X2 [Anoplophora glabripennis]|uniref:uncharacterized protein LOC108905853 isoform X2 n=1 Tax=Anoplophora glabripennis TaxID=217634 RepID=UPI000873D35B|nr:uncharacterized protein LOC108905853 isoform X2 [Anoplophora glabripennis]
MERLMEDANNVKNLLPWIDSNEDIINFMRKIPLDKSHIRNQLTLCYFLKKRDCHSNNFEKEIEDDAREIVIVMPDISYKEIKEKLSILGNTPNRKEIVIRQLIHKKHDLDKILKEITVSTVKKRKSDSSNDIFELDSNEGHTNINIKIRKVGSVAGSFEVVSRISSQDQLRTPKVFNVVDKEIEEPTTSVTSSTSHSPNSSPDSTVPSTTTEADDPYPELTDIISDVNTLESEMLKRKAPVNRPGIAASTATLNSVSNLPSNPNENVTEKPTDGNDTQSTKNKAEEEPKFNLIDFVKELSLASEYRIYQLCKQMGLNMNKRPREDQLNVLLNKLLDDVVEIKSAESSDSDSETQEYDYTDMLTGVFQYDVPNKKNRIDTTDKSSNSRDFQLREPVFILPPGGRNSVDAPKQTTSTQISTSVIQPARFNPSSSRENTIPALQRRASPEVGHNEPMPIINEEPIVIDNAAPGPSGGPGNMIIDSSDTNSEDMAINLTTNNKVNEPAVVMQPINEPVAGPSNACAQRSKVLDNNLVFKLMEMFPEAHPDYIKNICDGKKLAHLDHVLTVILSAPDYPKRPKRDPSPPKEVDPEEQFQIVKELLPDADPTYIRMQCEKFANDEKGLKEFINHAMEAKDYPTLKEYLRKQQISAQQRQYTTEFNMDNFIQLFPEPKKTFEDPKKNIKLDSYSFHYISMFFKNRYDKVSVKTIQQVLTQYNFKVLVCDKVLTSYVKKNITIRTRRRHVPLPENLENIPLLQELAYLTHKEDIMEYLLEKQKKDEQERREAKENNMMETCNCCYDDEVMPKDTFSCPNGCRFCKECIKRSCEVAFGDGKTDFPCLAACPTEFSLQTLQSVLPPKMFSKLAQKKALAEIKAAGIEELETCPFCDFASIPNELDKIFRCLNPDCMKESCRKCKEPNHLPLKCEEVEKDEDIKARIYIENKMTEALLRKCWKCSTSFFKEEGCNKMTCSCGASMCYICQQPVKDYSHFNGIGGDKYQLCPLYSDTNMVNQQNVAGAAAAAKAEIDPSKLKVDPTVGITDHYKDRAKKLPREPHMEVLHQGHHRHGHHRPRHRLEQINPAELNREQHQAQIRMLEERRHFAQGIRQMLVDLQHLQRERFGQEINDIGNQQGLPQNRH